jgi:hypothetical protein
MSDAEWLRKKLKICLDLANERRAISEQREHDAGEALHAASTGAPADWKAAIQRRDDAHADERAALRTLAAQVAEFLAGGSR